MVTAFAVKCFEWLHNLIFGSFNLVHQTVKEAIVGIKTILKLKFDESIVFHKLLPGLLATIHIGNS